MCSTSNLAEAHGEEIKLPILTLHDLLTEVAAHHPNKLALICRHQSPHFLDEQSPRSASTTSCLRWTHSQTRSVALRFATALKQAGARKGMGIATFLKNGAQYAIAFYAAVLLGCFMVPINPALVDKPDELQHMLSLAEPSVLMVWDTDMANRLNQSLGRDLVDRCLIKIICNQSRGSLQGWSDMHEMISAISQPESPSDLLGQSDGDDLALIIFTSGTTSRPKAVRQLNRTIVASARSSAQVLALDASRSTCNSLPAFHIFGIVYLLNFWIVGGAVCYPGDAFEPGAVIQAVHEERLTNLAGVPTMMNAIIKHPSSSKSKFESLIHIVVAATVVLSDTMTRIAHSLGVKRISASYGLSEAIPLLGVPFEELPCSFEANKVVSSGKCSPGVHIRVCAPDSRTVLQRGATGELHVSGPMVADGYVGNVDGEFYSEDGLPWIATGDQAVMDENGYVFVLGRYKDVIIRAGENISPASIEAVIDTLPDVTSQVIGIPDEIAGEVPLAVIKPAKGVPPDSIRIRDVVAKKLGPSLVPEETVSIHELGLADFPRTDSGKVRKDKLHKSVTEFLQRRAESDVGDVSDAEDSLMGMWARLLGLSKDALSRSTSIDHMADSVMIMRAAHKIEQRWGVALTVREMMENPTIQGLAKLIEERKHANVPHRESESTARQGPPQTADIAPALGSEEMSAAIQVAVQSVAQKMGLSWEEDVEDVLPIWDFGQVLARRLRAQSWNHRHAFLAPRTNTTQLRQALEKALENQPMLRTIVAEPTNLSPVHVIIRPSTKWFDLAITEVEAVHNAKDLCTLYLNDPDLDHAAAPGPLFRAIIVPVVESNLAGMVYQVQHSCFDGLSIPNLIEDLESVLEQGSEVQLPARTAYKSFADTLFLHRGSAQARIDCDFHVRRLRGLASLDACLWPAETAKGWFKGRFDDAADDVKKHRTLLDGDACVGVDGITRQIRLPGLQQTKQECGVSSPAIFKAALALLNIHMTGQKKAIFTNYEAGRDWPYHESWIANLLPNPMSVNGPTLEAVLNIIDIDASESCASLIKRVHEEQALLTKHAHAPLFEVQAQLGVDGKQLIETMRRQMFNWLPGLASMVNDVERSGTLQRVQLQSRSDVGLLWNCGMLDNECFHVNASFDDAQLRKTEVENAIEQLFYIAAWITDEKNRSTAVGELNLTKSSGQ